MFDCLSRAVLYCPGPRGPRPAVKKLRNTLKIKKRRGKIGVRISPALDNASSYGVCPRLVGVTALNSVLLKNKESTQIMKNKIKAENRIMNTSY